MELPLKRKLGALLAVLMLATPLALVTSTPASAAADIGDAIELEGDLYTAQSDGGGFWETVREWVCHPVTQAVGAGAGVAAAVLASAAGGAATAGVTFITVIVCNWEYFSRWVALPEGATPIYMG